MLYLEIVLNIPLNQSFTYSYDDENSKNLEKAEIGKRAEVRFGNRKMTGFIVKIFDEFPKSCTVPREKIRAITKIIDTESIFTPEIFSLAVWMSHYYICSIGEALFSIVPSTGKREVNIPSQSFENEFSDNIQKNLSDEQKDAIEKISSATVAQRPHTATIKSNYHYVFGATGTGKTEVFLRVAENVIKNGKSVIYLVPEIGLTPQVHSACKKRFGDEAVVLHSELTPSQKLAQWRKIINGEAKIVIGPRSAIFAPFKDLGLIIIDEEHDASYKSGDTPRYHARQVAMHRANTLDIPLLMGSATPSVEAFYLMKTGKIEKHTLSKRLSGGKVPEINCIDLSKTNNSGCISSELEKEMQKTLENGKQTILFLNRRGFTHFFRCSTCGFEILCKNCSVALTYHKNENRLKCHYCGYSIQPPSTCPKCNSVDVGYSGFGTEFIETETRHKFPNAKIIRIDRDSLTKKGELQEKLDAFTKGEYDIMLGTQMVAKGLNFPNLQLVGVILADTSLHLPDFRSSERTFSLITQVAGRAGRYFPDGKVIVQTYNPFQESIRCACENKIDEFYESELKIRKMQDFPPFTRLLRLVFRSATEKKAQNAAVSATIILKDFIKGKAAVIGPAECPILKISQNFRYQVILKSRDITILQKAAENLLKNYTHPQDIYIECDVDPVGMM